MRGSEATEQNLRAEPADCRGARSEHVSTESGHGTATSVRAALGTHASTPLHSGSGRLMINDDTWGGVRAQIKRRDADPVDLMRTSHS